MVNLDSGYDLKIYKQAPYLLASKDFWLGHLYLVTINKNIWNGLSEDDRSAIRRAAVDSYKKLGKTMDASFEQQLDILKKEGTTVRILDKSEVTAFKKATRFTEVQDKWAAEQIAKGLENAPEVLQKVRTLYQSTRLTAVR